VFLLCFRKNRRFAIDVSPYAVRWTGPGSNRRHLNFQSSALPTELPVRGANCLAGANAGTSQLGQAGNVKFRLTACQRTGRRENGSLSDGNSISQKDFRRGQKLDIPCPRHYYRRLRNSRQGSHL
jgi:hypothetical protein